MQRCGESRPEFRFSTDCHTIGSVNIRQFAYVAFGVILAACGTDATVDGGTTTIASPSTTTTSTMVMSDDGMDNGTDHEQDDGQHTHADSTREVDAANPPTLSDLAVTETDGGWLVTFDFTGHEFSEESKGSDHVDGQGHAHLYVDGTKLATIFGPSHLIEELPEGEHMISVTLNANDHATLTLDGEPIGAMAMITVEEGISPSATIEVANGEPTGGIVRIEVTQGDTVVLEVQSDVSDEVHVHGLDIYGDAVAGETLLMTFEATLTGIWEIELEGSGTQIAELLVNP